MHKILPQVFKDNLTSLLGKEFADFEASLLMESPVSIRLNDSKQPLNGFNDFLFNGEVPWCKTGKYLPARLIFTLDPLFHSGSYYVQEAASMFVEQCVNTVKQLADIDYVLDLCAAPGGKSTHLLSLFPDSLVISNEIISSRTGVLQENIAKWGNVNTVVTSSDPSNFSKLGTYFDFILVDAPCSGEGMFRKDQKALDEWSLDNVKHCAMRQQRILNDIWDALKPGGFMLYGTCTYNMEENEKNVKYIVENLGAESIAVDIQGFEGITESFDNKIHAYRFFPHKTNSEGLFLSLVRKNGDMKPSISKPFKQKNKVTATDSWTMGEYATILQNEKVYLLPFKFAGDIEYIGKKIHILSSGTEACTIKGKDFIPSFNLAHSKALNMDNFPLWHIDKETALKYLKKEVLFAPSNIVKGYILLVYEGVPLGWVKNIGSRCNNLLPPNRRIRMELQ